MIIDSHLHLPKRAEGKTLADSKQELLRVLEECRVDYGIVIPDNVPSSEIGSLDEVLSLVENEKHLFVMGTINIRKDKESHIQKLDRLFRTERIVAVKIFPGWEPIFPSDRRLTPVYELCVKHDLPIGSTLEEGSKVNTTIRNSLSRLRISILSSRSLLRITSFRGLSTVMI